MWELWNLCLQVGGPISSVGSIKGCAYSESNSVIVRVVLLACTVEGGGGREAFQQLFLSRGQR